MRNRIHELISNQITYLYDNIRKVLALQLFKFAQNTNNNEKFKFLYTFKHFNIFYKLIQLGNFWQTNLKDTVDIALQSRTHPDILKYQQSKISLEAENSTSYNII